VLHLWFWERRHQREDRGSGNRYYRRTIPADVRASLQKRPKERAPCGSRKTHISISLDTADRAADLASGSEDLSEEDAQDRRQAMMTTLTLPTFDHEDDEFSSR